MRSWLARLAVAFAVLLVPLFAGAKGGPAIELYLGPSPDPASALSRTVFPADAHSVVASFSMPSADKTRLEFSWTDPTGKLYKNEIKLAFPDKKTGMVAAVSGIDIADGPTSDSAGWWMVDVAFDGENLSKKFLLTNNRQVLALVDGTVTEKIWALRGVDITTEDGESAAAIGLQDPEPGVRAAAVRALGGAREELFAKMLSAASSDPSPEVRAAAAVALLDKGGDRGIAAAEAALADRSALVRGALARELHNTKDPAEGARLLGRLLADPDSGVANAALVSLSKLEGPEVFDALGQGLGSKNPELRRSILGIVEGRSGAGRVSVLVRGMGDTDASVRSRSLKAAAPEKGPEVTAAVRGLLDDRDEAIALSAWEYFRGAGDVEAAKQAAGSRHAGVRHGAALFLRDKAAKASVDVFSRLVEDDDPGIRHAAVEGLIKAGEQGVAGLVSALEDDEPGIRIKAARALRELGAPDAKEAMTDAYDDPEPEIRSEALGYLAKTGADTLPGVLYRAVSDPDPDVSKAALGHLLKLDTEESSEALIKSLDTADDKTVNAIANALIKRRDAAAVEWMKSAADYPQAGVRYRIAEALWGLGIREPMIRMARDTDVRVRRAALAIMVKSPGPDMLPALRDTMSFDKSGSRVMAVEALEGIPGEESGALLSSAVSDEAPEVREAAGRVVLRRGEEGDKSVVYGLGTLALDGDRGTSLRALDALAALAGGPGNGLAGELVDELVYRAYSSEDKEIRAAVLKALVKSKGRHLDALIPVAASDPEVELRQAAIKAAGGLSGPARAGAFISMLGSPYAATRLAGLEGLRGAADEKTVAALAEALGDPEAGIRLGALGQLAQLGPSDPSAHAALTGRLGRLLDDPNREVRDKAADTLLGLPDGDEKAGLLLLAAGSRYPETARTALDALLLRPDDRALDAYRKFYVMGYRRADIIRAAAGTSPAGAAGFMGFVYDNSAADGRLRIEALEALPKVIDGAAQEASLEVLERALGDRSSSVRAAAVKGIAELDGPSGAALLGRALSDPDPGVRRVALAGLEGSGGLEAARLMLPALGDREIRDDALEALAKRAEAGAPLMVAEYIKGLPDERFRAKAVGMLAEGGLDVDGLVAFLDDPAYEVRLEAAEAVSKKTGPMAAYGMLVAGGDAAPKVREIAAAGMADMPKEALAGAFGMLFENKKAVPGVLAFAAANIEDPALLVMLVERIAQEDETLLDAALAPLAGMRADHGLPAMAAGLRHVGPALRQRLLAAMSGYEGLAGCKALRDAYEAFPRMKEDVIAAAAKGGCASDMLRAALSDPDAAVRRYAAGLIGQVDEKDAEGLVSLALDDVDEEVRALAAEAASDGVYAGPLFRAAGDSSAPVRAAAARGLGVAGTAGASPETSALAAKTLAALALDADASVSDHAVVSLEGMGEKAPSASWREVAGAKDARGPARQKAIMILAKRKDPEAPGIFTGLLDSPEQSTRKAAAGGIVLYGPGALRAVHPLLADPARRRQALELLAEIGDQSSEAPILDSLSTMDESELPDALAALGRLGTAASLPALSDMYAKGTPSLKVSVIKALASMKLAGDEPVLTGMLRESIESPDDTVRFYGAWAAGELGAASLKKDIGLALEREGSRLVKKELERALEKLSNVKG